MVGLNSVFTCFGIQLVEVRLVIVLLEPFHQQVVKDIVVKHRDPRHLGLVRQTIVVIAQVIADIVQNAVKTTQVVSHIRVNGFCGDNLAHSLTASLH
jgi:hypothetical protein